MKLGVISDTHGNVERVKQAMQLFREEGVGHLIHCGDIGTSEVVEQMSGIPADYVFGNCDSSLNSLRKAIQKNGQTCQDRFGALTLAGKQICFLHGDDFQLLDDALRSGKWDLICSGHTHVADLSCVGTTLLLNPGAIQRTPTPSVAIVDLPELNVRTKKVGG